MTSLAIVNKAGPLSGQAGQEALDLAMAASNFGVSVRVFFIDDGVFQLLANQSPETSQRKHFAKGFSALEFYDIEDIYVSRQSLETRALDEKDLIMPVALVDEETIYQELSYAAHVVTLS